MQHRKLWNWRRIHFWRLLRGTTVKSNGCLFTGKDQYMCPVFWLEVYSAFFWDVARGRAESLNQHKCPPNESPSCWHQLYSQCNSRCQRWVTYYAVFPEQSRVWLVVIKLSFQGNASLSDCKFFQCPVQPILMEYSAASLDIFVRLTFPTTPLFRSDSGWLGHGGVQGRCQQIGHGD